MPNDEIVHRKVWYWRPDTTRLPDSTGNRKGKSSLKYNWPEIGKVIREQLKKLGKKHGFRPTLRELYYALVSLQVLPNLAKAYGSLDRVMTEARVKGKLDADCLSDERHPVSKVEDVYYTPEDWIEYFLDDKLGIISDTFHEGGKFFPRWLGQLYYVEIWTEKQAMVKHFTHIVNKANLQVRIVAFGGFPGFAELNEHVDRLNLILAEKNVRVLWFGDLDPSGESIDRTTIERLHDVPEWSKLYEPAPPYYATFDLKRVAVTKQQIIDYKLPWNTSHLTQEEQEKLQNDPRYVEHVRRNDGEAYACEVDSLPTIYPDEFNNIVVEAVNQYFDEDVYNDGVEHHKQTYPEKYVNDRLDYRVREFLEWINMKLKWEWLES